MASFEENPIQNCKHFSRNGMNEKKGKYGIDEKHKVKYKVIRVMLQGA